MKVLAEGADGVNELCFSVHAFPVLYFMPFSRAMVALARRMTTPLGKMMKAQLAKPRISHASCLLIQAWCDHHQVPAEEAAFLLGERLVKPEDRLGRHSRGSPWHRPLLEGHAGDTGQWHRCGGVPRRRQPRTAVE